MENKNYVFRVSALYDMNIDKDEEIVQEIYATEDLAQERVKELIKSFKENFNDGQSYCDCWDEGEYRLYAYMDSEWNVDISYKKEEIRTRKESDRKAMKKYSVRIYLHTFVDYEVMADNMKDAIDEARNLDYDIEQMLENMVPDEEEDVTELTLSTYDMKLSLEADGWDWNVLDMMDEDEIKCKYDEINNN